MQKKLMRISEYRKKFFVAGSEPTEGTVRRWIASGTIPGEKIGCTHYVNVATLNLTGNPLVDASWRHHDTSPTQ
jgi:hypothetical protein